MSAPIEITLYQKGKDPGPGTLYSKAYIPWALLKRALRLSDEMDTVKEPTPVEIASNDFYARFQRWLHRNDRPISSEEQVMDQISAFVVDVFDQQFTVQQLEDGADAAEVMNVLNAVVRRAQVMPSLPTNPPPKPRLRKGR